MTTDEGWEPMVGQLVILRMWSPEGTGQRDRRYGQDEVMRLAGVWEHTDPTEYARSLGAEIEPRDATGWWLVDPSRPGDQSHWSWVDSEWAELLPAETLADAAMLF